MAAEHVLALDLGTSAARCLVCQSDGTPIGLSERGYPLASLDGLSEFAREFAPQDLAGLLDDLVREALAGVGLSGQDIAAVGVTSQRQGLAFLDEAGRELYVGPNLDLRAVFEGAAMDQEHGRQIYRTTGHLPSFFFAPAKLLWFRNHRPALYGRITTVLSLAAWVVYRMTGELADEPALQGEAGLLDLRQRRVATSLMTQLGVESGWLAPPVQAGAAVGGISAAVSQRSGLAAGAPVALSGPDSQSGLLAMGMVEPGQVGVVAGWSAPVQMVTSKPVLDRRRRTWAGCHVIPGCWVLEANPGDTGNTYAQVKALVAPHLTHETLQSLAAEVPLGSAGVLAFLGPRPLPLHQPGLTPGGLLFPVPLTYQTMKPEHLVRATLENIGYAVRACLELLEAVAQLGATSVHLGGGMAQSSLFAQTLADVLGRTVTHHTAHVSGGGAALCAAVAAGRWTSLGEAAAAAGEHFTLVEPDRLNAAQYGDLFHRWQRLRQRLERMAGVME